MEQGAPEQDCPNEPTEDGGYQQGHDKEDIEVQKVDGQVEATGHLAATLQAVAPTDIKAHQEESEQAVDGHTPQIPVMICLGLATVHMVCAHTGQQRARYLQPKTASCPWASRVHPSVCDWTKVGTPNPC